MSDSISYKPVLIFLGLITLTVVAGVGLVALWGDDPVTAPSNKQPGEGNGFNPSAACAEYEANPAAADDKYSRIELDGYTVKSIKDGPRGTYVLHLSGNGGEVLCGMELFQSSGVAKLSRGDTVNLTGRWGGCREGIVILVECYLRK